jgi:hypothetical protein
MPEPAPPARPAPVVPLAARAAEEPNVDLANGRLLETPIEPLPVREEEPSRRPPDPAPEPPQPERTVRRRGGIETRIFVPPRAPDDPGPEAFNEDADTGHLRPSGAKA